MENKYIGPLKHLKNIKQKKNNNISGEAYIVYWYISAYKHADLTNVALIV